MESRLHFCTPSAHAWMHGGKEVVRTGPAGITAQWVCERLIGTTGAEIRSDRELYANIGKVGLKISQINTLRFRYPELRKELELPRGAIDIGEGYVLLRRKDEEMKPITGTAGLVIQKHLRTLTDVRISKTPDIIRWARLRLPNGTIARSKWKEEMTPEEKVRMSRNVQLHIKGGNEFEYAEVHFYFSVELGPITKHYALVEMYTRPDQHWLDFTFQALWVVSKGGVEGLHVVDISTLEATVTVPPLMERPGPNWDKWFVGHRPGLDIGLLGGYDANVHDDDD